MVRTCFGLGMMHVHSQMMVKQIKIFLANVANDWQLSIMYRATLESLQLEVGSMHDVFSLPYHKYHFLATHSWLKVMWLCLHKYDIKLRKMDTAFHKQRVGDASLMDSIIDSNIFSQNDLRETNNCRLYLQVFYLSDIASGDGSLIMHHYVTRQYTIYAASHFITEWKERWVPVLAENHTQIF